MSNQERQAAYRQVVQSLIQSPQNDEERILAANPDLVDEGLVKALKDKAMMMMRRNDPALGATIQRLVSFAQKLERKLASSQTESVELKQEDYIRFSFELLQAVTSSQGDGEIVHQYLDRHRAFLNEELLSVLPQSIEILTCREPDLDRQAHIRSIAKMLAIDLQTYPRGDRSICRQLAIACKEPSLLVQSQPDKPVDLTELEPEPETQIEPTAIEPELEPAAIEPELEPAAIEPELELAAETKPTNEDSQITTYFQLVQALLECPLNEEDRLLAAHPELVDAGLVRALLTAVETLKELNNPDSAWTIEWLSAFAEQLSQKLGLPEMSQPKDGGELDDFFLDLLQTVANSQGDGAIVHQFFDEHLSKLDRNLLVIFHQQAKLLLEREENPDWKSRVASILGSLGNELQEFPRGNRSINLELSIACYDLALLEYTREKLPLDWAMTQMNRANVYQARIEGDKRENLDEAIRGYEAALTIFTPSNLPIEALTTSRALGQIYFNQGEWQLAVDTYEIAMASVETSRDWVVNEDRRKEMLNDALSIYENAIQCAINLQNYPEAIQYTERIRSRQLVELMARKDRSTPAANSPEIPRYLEKVETITYPDIQKLIHNPHTAILTCYTTDDDTHIFIIKQSGAPTLHTCENQGGQKFQNWLQKIWINPSHDNNSNWVDDLPRLLHDISQRLELDTLIEQHLTNIHELIIIPHLNLHQIPFAALPITALGNFEGKGGEMGEGGRMGRKELESQHSDLSPHSPHSPHPPHPKFLSDKFIIRSIPSCQILQHCQQRPPITTAHIGTVEDADDTLLGARSVQSTLWSVDDYVSVIFNVMYHQERRKGTNRSISLHTAQSQLRNLTGAEFQRTYYSHAIEYVTKHHPTLKTALENHLEPYCEMDKPFESPYYWAAFITQGMA